ncbi:MAG: hypothetical protein ACRC3I_07690 [Cetobacterium sp.]
MKNLFWGNVEEIIKVDANIPDKNLYILKNLYPDAEIIKESSRQFNNSELVFSKENNLLNEIIYENYTTKTIIASYEIAA